MGREDWYRNAEWNTVVEAAFRQKLNRARDKSQYLRIQAHYLAQTYPQSALSLLEQYFTLRDRSDLSQAYVDKARALVAVGDIESAVLAYESALKREQEFPNSISTASLDLACLVATERLEGLYERALELVRLNNQYHIFPIQRYLANGAHALILKEIGRPDEARKAAQLAMTAANEGNSGFRYHQSIGLVSDSRDEFGKRIKMLL